MGNHGPRGMMTAPKGETEPGLPSDSHLRKDRRRGGIIAFAPLLYPSPSTAKKTAMSVWAILLAAGQGSRLAASGLATKKQFLPYEGAPLFWKSARTMVRVPRIAGFVFVFPEDETEHGARTVKELAAQDDFSLPCLVTAGGARRQDSVQNGLAMLPKDCTHVLVHDSARPFASAPLIASLLAAMDAGHGAVIPAIPVADTIKRVAEDGTIAETLPRAELRACQTPQAFALPLLQRAHAICRDQNLAVTDDASMVEAIGESVVTVPGEAGNIKITTPEDLRMLTTNAPVAYPCVGWGYDVHKYGPGRPLKIGGIPIDGDLQVVAHSDGDVLLHALADALLGCLGKGDIGQHFPDNDPAFDNIESAVLVAEVLDIAHREALTITHADLTIIAQTPKLSTYRRRIRDNVAQLLRVDPARVNVKATTEEGLGFTGKKHGIKAVACVTGMRQPQSAEN